MQRNKRVALTLTPELDAILTQLSELTATPKTAIITEILNDMTPILTEVVSALKQTKEGQKELAIETAAKFLQGASQMLNQAHIDFGGIKAKHGDK